MEPKKGGRHPAVPQGADAVVGITERDVVHDHDMADAPPVWVAGLQDNMANTVRTQVGAVSSLLNEFASKPPIESKPPILEWTELVQR